MRIDLQLHSTYSDGYLSPTELADFLLKNQVKIASLTDHNTVGGLEEFQLACQKKHIKAIIGIEIYVKLNHKKFNLLWYNFDDKNPDLHKFLRLSQARRRNQIRRALLKLKSLGLIINENKILDKYNHYISLNRIMSDVRQIANNRKTIAERLGVKSPSEDEIIKHFFKNREINKLEECYINFSHIIALKKKIGGQIILNHPGKSSRINESFIVQLKKLGLDGIEVVSPHHSIHNVMLLQRLAKKYKLIMTGGSDYHLNEGGNATIQNVYAYFKIEPKYLTGINKIIG
ncbi:MAG: PHP domain-containing protein [bacterium]|nr:PHP domain-containing protein [bacterium]